MAVDLAPLALRPVIGKHPVEPPNFFKSILRRPFEPAAVFAIQNPRIGRPHSLDAGLQPQLLETGASSAKTANRNKTTTICFIWRTIFRPGREFFWPGAVAVRYGFRIRRPH